MINDAWMDLGACQGTDAEDFFSDDPDAVAYAKAVCAGCPVSADCLRHAVTHGERHGVWGGLTADERRSVRLRPTAVRSHVRRPRHLRLVS